MYKRQTLSASLAGAVTGAAAASGGLGFPALSGAFEAPLVFASSLPEPGRDPPREEEASRRFPGLPGVARGSARSCSANKAMASSRSRSERSRSRAATRAAMR